MCMKMLLLNSWFNWVVIFALILYAGHLKISLSPFSIELPAWRMSVGMLFFLIGVLFMTVQIEMNAVDKYQDRLIEYLENNQDGKEEKI